MNTSKNNKVAVITSAQGKKGELQFSPITLRDDYRKKWNERISHDFICLTIDGELVNESLYRKGGIGGKWNGEYMLILKYVEDVYDENLIKGKSYAERRHLSGRWCIINKQGKEMVVFDAHKSVYLKGGVIYCESDNYYNIETGEFYCRSYKQPLESDEFLFLQISYDATHKFSANGVMKICKKDGSFEVFEKS